MRTCLLVKCNFTVFIAKFTIKEMQAILHVKRFCVIYFMPFLGAVDKIQHKEIWLERLEF